MIRLVATATVSSFLMLMYGCATTSPSLRPKAYVVLEITVHDPSTDEQYRQKVEPLIERYGGRYVIRSGGKSFDNDPNSAVVSPEGQWVPDRFIVLEFDSQARIREFANSPEYKEIVHLRHDSATTKSLVTNGFQKSK